jgi:outer membrane protein insertion porin family
MLRRLLILALLGSPVFAVAKTTHPSKKSEDIKIKAVKFVGVKNVPIDELKAVLANKKSSFLGLVSINGKYRPNELKGDQVRLRDVYYQHGYLDARISRPKLAIDPATSEATITYHVQEGLPYNASRVRIVKRNDVDTAAIARHLKLRSGKRFNVQQLRKDIQTITREVGNSGHAFVQVQPRFRKNVRNHTISIVYFIKPGRKGVIGNVRIHGNTKTKDSVVRSYIALAPGDRFRMDDLISTQDELMRTGFFSSVNIRPVAARNGHVDLDVTVKEDKTGNIMGAAGYDSVEGLFVEGSFSEKNIFGSGITAGLSASYSKLKKNGTLSFDDPRVAGTMFGLYGGLFYTTTQDDTGKTYGFDKKEKGGYLGIRRRISSVLNGSIDYTYNDVRYSNIDAVKFPGGLRNYTKSSIGVALTFNNTDNFSTPRRGIYAKARVEYAGFGSGVDLAKYLKGSLKFAAYYDLKNLTGYDLITRYKMRGTYIHDMGFIPEAERLHIGGYYNGVRGYRSASINPGGKGAGGGLMSMVNSLELSMSLSEKNKVRLTGFVDHGMIGNTKLDEVTAKSVGAQIEWRSPMGDVNFVLAKTIGSRPAGSSPSSFEFTIGKEF